MNAKKIFLTVQAWMKTSRAFFDDKREYATLLRPTLLQVLAGVGPAIVFFVVSQGVEVLEMLGESVSEPPYHSSAVFCFIAANIIGGLSIWWTARVVMNLGLGTAPRSREEYEVWEKHRNLIEGWPRFLGALPIGLIGLAFLFRLGVDQRKWDMDLTKIYVSMSVLGLIHIAIAFGLYKLFVLRRKIFPQYNYPKYDVQYHSFTQWWNNARGRLQLHFAFLVIAFLFIIALWRFPVGFAQFLGSGALLSLAGACAVIAGTWLLHIRAVTGVPVVPILVAWIFLASVWNDKSHLLHHSGPSQPLPQALTTVQDAFANWVADPAFYPPGQREPVFIVATEGGGIRAAYWTASALGCLQEGRQHVPPGTATLAGEFVPRTFAISSISGGSIGAAVFDALLASKEQHLVETSQKILGADHLAPLIGGLLFMESIQKLSPITLRGSDRGIMLEDSFADAFQAAEPNSKNWLSEPSLSLWYGPDAAPRLPNLFFNSTVVETGQRMVFSNLRLPPGREVVDLQTAPAPKDEVVHPGEQDFNDVLNGRYEVYDGQGATNRWMAPDHPLDVPLITAAHASARFTYTNPPGTLSDGQHCVDGGYFEDSGATAALEILKMLEQDPRIKPKIGVDFVPVVIFIRNAPIELADTGTATGTSTPMNEEKDIHRPAEQQSNPNSFASELMAPPDTLLNAQSARGAYARLALWQECHLQQFPVLEIHLVDDKIPLPLGWALSLQAENDMQHQAWSAFNQKEYTQAWDYIQYGVPQPPQQTAQNR